MEFIPDLVVKPKVPSRFSLRKGIDFPMSEKEIQEEPLTQAVISRKRTRPPKPIDGSSTDEDPDDPESIKRTKWRHQLYESCGAVMKKSDKMVTPSLHTAKALKILTDKNSQRMVCILENLIFQRDRDKLLGHLDFWVEKCPRLCTSDNSFVRIYKEDRILLELRVLSTDASDGWDFNQRLLFWHTNDYSFNRRRFNLLSRFVKLTSETALYVAEIFLQEEGLQETPLRWRLQVPCNSPIITFGGS